MESTDAFLFNLSLIVLLLCLDSLQTNIGLLEKARNPLNLRYTMYIHCIHVHDCTAILHNNIVNTLFIIDIHLHSIYNYYNFNNGVMGGGGLKMMFMSPQKGVDIFWNHSI